MLTACACSEQHNGVKADVPSLHQPGRRVQSAFKRGILRCFVRDVLQDGAADKAADTDDATEGDDAGEVEVLNEGDEDTDNDSEERVVAEDGNDDEDAGGDGTQQRQLQRSSERRKARAGVSVIRLMHTQVDDFSHHAPALERGSSGRLSMRFPVRPDILVATFRALLLHIPC